jgi:hypothetical protein
MNKKERDSRRKTGQTVGRILGIELFEDTRIQRIAVIPAHYAAVGIPGCEIDDGHADFPLADLDQPDAANTTVMIVILRLHPGEPMTGAYQFRYHHRDSVSPADGLDLKRRWHFLPRRSERPGQVDRPGDRVVAHSSSADDPGREQPRRDGGFQRLQDDAVQLLSAHHQLDGDSDE